MKRQGSCQSLHNSRRGSVQKIVHESREEVEKQGEKGVRKHRVASPIVKSIKLEKQEGKYEQRKNDIKQIYQYKIKQRAQKCKIIQKSKHSTNQDPQYNNEFSTSLNQDKRLIESLRLENEKMSKQLSELINQNKQLKAIVTEDKNKSNKNTSSKQVNQKDYKKSILNKLNDRHRIKTQMTASFTKLNQQTKNTHDTNHHDVKSKNNSSSKNLEQPRNSITMNLNMSFVKIKSPSTSKNVNNRHDSKQIINKIHKSSSNKRLNFKQHGSKSMSKLNHNSSTQNSDIKSLFSVFLQKKSITSKDLTQFYLLNKKIFAEFNSLISFSRQVFTEILNKVDISQCYDSKRMQQSGYSKSDNNMKETLKMIQELYKVNSLHMSKRQFASPLISQKKYHVTEIEQQDTHQTPESSVVSFSDLHHNVERKKSLQTYRLQKLNQNLDLFMKMENKKLKTSQTQAETTESKVYFSKPISSNVSRKISFNNSFNNSLKNSKIE